MKTARPFRVMFVCLGNVCRSPLAHAVFESKANDAGLSVEVESSGTSAYHVGDHADRRMRSTAARHGVTIDHRSRQLEPGDLDSYDLLLAMDSENLRDIRRMRGARDATADIRLFREFDPVGPGDVPDPYYGGPDGFETVFEMVDRTAEALVDEIRRRAES